MRLQKENQQLKMGNDILYPEGYTNQTTLLGEK